MLSNGESGIISSIAVEHHDEAQTTYNFEVSDLHTYYVGSEGILVHNACGTDLIDDGIGFDTFDELKDYLGPAGEGKEWHHIVEQSQIGKSGFTPQQIHNTKNVIALDKGIHGKISGYYSSKQVFSGNQSVRNWLDGQSYQSQYKFGLNIIKMFGG